MIKGGITRKENWQSRMNVARGMREWISEGRRSEAEARRDVNVIYKKSSKMQRRVENREL